MTEKQEKTIWGAVGYLPNKVSIDDISNEIRYYNPILKKYKDMALLEYVSEFSKQTRNKEQICKLSVFDLYRERCIIGLSQAEELDVLPVLNQIVNHLDGRRMEFKGEILVKLRRRTQQYAEEFDNPLELTYEGLVIGYKDLEISIENEIRQLSLDELEDKIKKIFKENVLDNSELRTIYTSINDIDVNIFSTGALAISTSSFKRGIEVSRTFGYLLR